MSVSVKRDFTSFNSQQETELKRVLAAVQADLTAIKTSLDNIKAIYDVHVHTADGLASRTSRPDTGTATGSPSAASAITTPATLTLTD